MKSYSIAAALVALAGALAILQAPASAQQVSAPVLVKPANPSTQKQTKTKGEWLKAEVIHADATSIVVREQADERMIHTFTIPAEMKDKMQAIVDRGGYQYGDRVKILHQHGQTVALKISGRPSKPS